MLKFSYAGSGLIKAITLSKSSDPADSSLVMSLSMDCMIDFRTLPDIDPSGRLGDLWYREGGLVRGEFVERTVVRLKPASYLASFAFAKLPEVSVSDVRCTTRQFSMVPKDQYQVSLDFDLSILGDADLLVRLTKMLKIGLTVTIIPEQQELPETEAITEEIF